MALYCVGLLLLLAVLVTRSPWFGFFAFTGYLHTWELLAGRWRIAGVTAAAVIRVTAIFGGRLPDRTRRRWPPICCGGGHRRPGDRLQPLERDHGHAERAAQADHRRAGRGQRQAGGGDGRERRAARPAARPGPGGRRPGRAPADGPRDPRHPGPGPDRHRHPAPGGRAGRRPAPATGAGTSTTPPQLARESLSEARRSVQALRPEPLEDGPAAGGAGRGGRALVGAARGPRPRSPPPAPPGRCTRRSRSRCCAPPRRRWPTWPGTPRATRVGLTLSYMEDVVDAGRPRRRRRLRPRRARRGDRRRLRPDGDARSGSARLAGTLQVESEPGGGTAISACVPGRPAGGRR